MTQTVSEKILRRLHDALNPLTLKLGNDSADHAGHMGDDGSGDTHWSLAITSTQFIGKTRVERHRMVTNALGDLMDNPIHALSIKAHAPEEER